MLGFPIIIAVLQTALFLFVFKYETPKFLYIRKKRRICDEALSKIYITNADIDRVMSKIKAVTLSQGAGGEAGWKDLFGRTYITALIVVLALHCFQQLAGGNTFMMFSTKIFESAAKGDHTLPLIGTILAGLVTIDGVFSFSLIADEFGRKIIMTYGTLALVIFLLCMAAFSYFKIIMCQVAGIMGCLFFYSLSIGPVTWIYTSELLPPKGIGLATAANWFLVYGLIFLCNKFFTTKEGIASVLTVFAGFTFCAFLYSIIVMKETKGNFDIENKLLYAPKDIRLAALTSPVITPKQQRCEKD
eukprot:TRINITY_DN4022_c0_g1_i8.p1 TRINITY_DN4022_c0_g1~~TRINITY_DN4022_c0_g1_i8.p1  ORF type:complete len:302 (+),score=54.78 TRINITY_DN4022_c0_g1_i8:483-1388(+)